MEGEERPQKMRKLSRDHEESQAESVATKNDSNAPENEDAAQPVTEENTATQENANAEIAPAPAVQSAATVATDGQNPPLSKNQLKKLRKNEIEASEVASTTVSDTRNAIEELSLKSSKRKHRDVEDAEPEKKNKKSKKEKKSKA